MQNRSLSRAGSPYRNHRRYILTPIGYLKLGPLELTLIMVPAIIGAVTLGPAAGAFLGLVFGASSFIQCFSLERIRRDTYFYKRI